MAQNPKKGTFKQENLFFGSGLNLGFSGQSFNIGINPEAGYSITNFLDAGLSLNLNYYSENPSNYSNVKYENLSYGGGPFLRLWPLNFINIQVQPEFNWTSSTQKDNSINQTNKYNYHSQSLLIGIGYGSRYVGSRFSYVTLMMDVLQDPFSPYRDQFNDPIPVFRAGFGFYLRPSRK
jgi:hypothetical protein